MQPKSGIYKIANKVTGGFYIGSSINLKRRFIRHKSNLKKQSHDNQILQRVYNKYGINNLSFEILEYVNNKINLISREQFYMDTLNPRYNICKIAGSNLGRKLSKEAKDKISKAHKGKKLTKEHRNKLSKAKKGNKNALGHVLSVESKNKISIANKGKHLSKEHKNKISDINSKSFIIKNPSGKIIIGVGLRKFCRKNNLNNGCMSLVINNKRKSHKGYINAN